MAFSSSRRACTVTAGSVAASAAGAVLRLSPVVALAACAATATQARQKLSDKYSLSVDIQTYFDREEPAVEFTIHKKSLRDFMYGIKTIKREVSEQLIKNGHLPHIRHNVTYIIVLLNK